MRIKILLLLSFFVFSFVQINAQNARKYTTYVVKPDETLRSIAKKVGCRYKEIKNLNPDVNKRHPRVNTTLVIPNKNYGKPVKEKKVAAAKGITIHIVKKGNTLFGIAKQYNVTIQSLIEANPHATKGLQLGQKIRIPSKEEYTIQPENRKVVFYKVQKGDTKWRIATIHNISVEELDKLNPKHVGELKENENILVPAKEEIAREIKDTYKQERDSLFVYHIVKQGEGLFRIAVLYGTTQEEIKKLNPEATKLLRPGMLLKIPAKKKDSFLMYQIIKDDTFYSLSKKYKTSEEELIKLNPELEEGLKLGMFIKIAVLPKTDNNSKEGDSINLLTDNYILDSIAIKHNVHLSFLMPLMYKDSANMSEKDKKLQSICTDFYMGAELAIDSIRHQGIDVTYHIYDTKNDPSQLYKILQENDLKKSNAIIGPFFINNAKKIAHEMPDIPVFTPSKRKTYSFEPNLVKTAANSKDLSNHLVQYLKQHYHKQKIIIIPDTNYVNINKANTIKRMLLEHDSIKNITIIEASRNKRNSAQVYMDKKKLEKSVDKNNENWVILLSDVKVISSDIVNTYGVMANDKKIKLFTTKIFNDYQYLDFSLLSELNWSFPATEFSQLNSDTVKAFKQKYKSINFTNPNDYSYTGFDLTYDAIMRIVSYENLSDALNAGKSLRLSRVFDYQLKSDHYENQGVMMVSFDKDLNFNLID